MSEERSIPISIDHAAVLAHFDGDAQLVGEVVDLFLEECPRSLSEIGEALARGDGDAVERQAHSLKGSVGHFHVRSATEAALRLEKMGRDGDLTGAGEALAELERQMELLQPALLALKAECAV